MKLELKTRIGRIKIEADPKEAVELLGLLGAMLVEKDPTESDSTGTPAENGVTLLCNKCKKIKPLGDFRRRKGVSMSRAMCRACELEKFSEIAADPASDETRELRRCRMCGEKKSFEAFEKYGPTKRKLDCIECRQKQRDEQKPTGDLNPKT